jgi:16S rRNA (guanine527-N7)-methyltransferase
MIETEAQARDWISAQDDIHSRTPRMLERFEEVLRAESKEQNLVSARTLDEVWVRHFADSLQLLRGVPRETSSWLDLGTGAGFPGVAIAIARPDIAVSCVESRALRTDYLSRAVAGLGLQNCTIVHSRLQDVETAKFGVISARAFAPLPKLLDLSTRFSTQDTEWRLPKGRSAAQELNELRGWEHMFHVEQSLTDADAGIICGRLIGRNKGKRS